MKKTFGLTLAVFLPLLAWAQPVYRSPFTTNASPQTNTTIYGNYSFAGGSASLIRAKFGILTNLDTDILSINSLDDPLGGMAIKFAATSARNFSIRTPQPTNVLEISGWSTVNFESPVSFIGNISGSNGTFSGPVLSTSPSTNGPAETEFVTGGWVRGLLAGTGVEFFATTNLAAFGTNVGSGFPLYTFTSNAIPFPAVLTFAGVTNGQYLYAATSTNPVQAVTFPIVLNGYVSFPTGGGRSLTAHAEVYFSYDRTNWFGDVVTADQVITGGVTNLYQWTVSFPTVTSTNASGLYVQGRLKVGVQTANPNVSFWMGTNTPSHVDIAIPNPSAGNAFLAANQTFTGVNIFNNNVGIGTNSPQAALHVVGTAIATDFQGDGSAVSNSGSWFKGYSFVVEGDSLSKTNSPTAINWPSYLSNAAPALGCYWMTNAATGGDTASNMVVTFSATLGPWMPTNSGSNVVLFIWGGINDVSAGHSQDDVFSNITNLWAMGRASGAKVVGFTLTQTTNWGTTYSHYWERIEYINELLRRHATNCDVLVDTGTIMGNPYDQNMDPADPATHFSSGANEALYEHVVWKMRNSGYRHAITDGFAERVRIHNGHSTNLTVSGLVSVAPFISPWYASNIWSPGTALGFGANGENRLTLESTVLYPPNANDFRLGSGLVPFKSINVSNVLAQNLYASNIITGSLVERLRVTNDLAGAASNIVVNADTRSLRVVVTNNMTLTNWPGLELLSTKSVKIWFVVSAGGPWSILYPTDGASFGLFWRTNFPPQGNRPYTSFTNGHTYVLTTTFDETNAQPTMTEWTYHAP